MKRFLPALFTAAALTAAPGLVYAQTPTPPPLGWSGSAGAGLAMTDGNKDTSTVNASYELKHDDGGKLVFKSNALLVWGRTDGEVNSDRLGLEGRIDRKISARTSVFGQTQYLHDQFKSITHLVSPTVGLSRLLVKDDRTELAIDGGVGVIWEQNPGLDMTTDGAFSAGQQFSRKLTTTTELKEKIAGLWKARDFGDALYTIGVGVAASVTGATQIKVEFLDTYKARPPFATVQKNDIATLLSFVYKFE